LTRDEHLGMNERVWSDTVRPNLFEYLIGNVEYAINQLRNNLFINLNHKGLCTRAQAHIRTSMKHSCSVLSFSSSAISFACGRMIDESTTIIPCA
jgi:hypothetical protein